MIENKRFAIIDGIKKGTHSGIWDNQKQNNQRIGDELWLGEVVGMLNEGVMIAKENEQLKKELKKYTDAFDCGQCRFQNYDWFDDGDEFEVCEKGNNEAQMENHSCSEWEEK